MQKEEKFVEMNLESPFHNVSQERINHIKRCFLPSWMRMIEQDENKEASILITHKKKNNRWVKLQPIKNSKP
jgi:hypothetical protein